MEGNFITQILLPLALFIIMLGMGLTLVPNDFKRVLLFPKAIAVGLVLKLLMVPLITFGILFLIPLQPELSVGFILLAACPGGATTNLIAHLAKGDVALSITLTALASCITVFTIPILVNIGLEHFMGETMVIKLPVLKTIFQILAITIIPVMIGMVINYKYPEFSKKSEPLVKKLSALFLVLIVLAALLKEQENILDFFKKAGPVALILNIIGMLLGYFFTKLFTGKKDQAVTVGIEVGVVNGTLGIAIAAGILQNSVMTIPSAIYSLIMFPAVLLMIYIGTRK